MKCERNKDGICVIMKEEATPEQCDGCSFFKPDIEEKLIDATEVIEGLKAEIDSLNKIILEYRAKNNSLNDKVLDYEFKAKLFDALVKGLS